MAKYPVTHTCGHSEKVDLVGRWDERERRLAWLSSRPCLACQRAAEQAAAEQAAAASGLPALTGSEKQIAWATRIRAELLDKVAQEREPLALLGRRQGASDAKMAEEMGKFDAAVARLTMQTAASWWIDHRNSSPMGLLREVV